MKTITILNFKGGVGKSETTRNLAKGFVDSGYRVLVIDNDPQANTTKFLNGSKSLDQIQTEEIHSENELIKVFLNQSEEQTALEDLYDHPELTKQAIIHTDVLGLDLLPCSLKLANTDTALRMDSMKPQHDRLKKILRQIKNDYDYCLIDCPPVLNLLTVNALVASNSDCIIPIKIDFAGLQGWAMTVKYIDSLKDGFDIELDYKVVFTMVQKTKNAWFKSGLKMIKLFNTIIPNKTFQTIIRNQNSPIVTAGFNKHFVIDDQTKNVGKDYLALAEEIKKYY